MKLIGFFAGIAVLSAIMIIGFGCERKVVNEISTVAVGQATYVGSQACAPAECHGSIYETFSVTGHPFKLNRAADVQAGNYYPDFVADLPGTPPGSDWSEVTYVIGGYWWKARFIDTGGYIFTGDEKQWNFPTNPLGLPGAWVSYSSGEKPYDCGPCHTTGYDESGHQDNLEGIVGTWAFPGIQCEECHGPASLHINNPKGVDMTVDRSSELCGKCHIRSSLQTIPTSGGFIRHHEQWNEMARTKHRGMSCVDCHDPHKGLHPNNPDRAEAIVMSCENCHFEEYLSFQNSGLLHAVNNIDCIDCHMPYAARSAVGDISKHMGDVRSHLMRINSDSTAQFIGSDGANGYLTLDFTCLAQGCHLGETVAWAANNAHEVHVSTHKSSQASIPSETKPEPAH